MGVLLIVSFDTNPGLILKFNKITKSRERDSEDKEGSVPSYGPAYFLVVWEEGRWRPRSARSN